MEFAEAYKTAETDEFEACQECADLFSLFEGPMFFIEVEEMPTEAEMQMVADLASEALETMDEQDFVDMITMVEEFPVMFEELATMPEQELFEFISNVFGEIPEEKPEVAEKPIVVD